MNTSTLVGNLFFSASSSPPTVTVAVKSVIVGFAVSAVSNRLSESLIVIATSPRRYADSARHSA